MSLGHMHLGFPLPQALLDETMNGVRTETYGKKCACCIAKSRAVSQRWRDRNKDKRKAAIAPRGLRNGSNSIQGMGSNEKK